MSDTRLISYVDDRLRAMDRDNTFKFGQLALQVKKDVSELRAGFVLLNERIDKLQKQLNPEKLNGEGTG